MGFIEAIYITDDKSNLIFQYLLSPATPNFDYIISKLDSVRFQRVSEKLISQSGNDDGLEPIVEIDSKTIATTYPYHDMTFYIVGENYLKKENIYIYTSSEDGSDTETETESENETETEGEDDEEVDEEEEDDEIDEIDGNDYEQFRDNETEKVDEDSIENTKANNSSHDEQESKNASDLTKDELKDDKPFVAYNPLIYHDFFKQLITVMGSCISNPLSANKLKSNFEVLNLILQNMVDYEYPYITDLNQIRELMPNKSLLDKLLTSTKKLSQGTNTTSSSTSVSSVMSRGYNQQGQSYASLSENNNKIPWRKSNVKYTNNEMFVDLVEIINIIIPPSRSNKNTTRKTLNNRSSAFYSTAVDYSYSEAKPIVARINGKIEFTSHLSGIPDLELVLDVGRHDLGVPSFHPCIRIDKWLNKNGVLSFIPPDGKSTLAEYEIDLLNNEVYGRNTREILKYLGLVSVDFRTGLGNNQDEFEIRLNISMSKQVKAIDNLKIDIFCGADNDGKQDSDTNFNIRSLKLTHGDLLKVSNDNYKWILDKNLSFGVSPILRGVISNGDVQNDSFPDSSSTLSGNSRQNGETEHTWSTNTKSKKVNIIAPKYIQLNYSNKGTLASGMKVNSLQILSAKGLGENVKPYKGVKYITKAGDFILR
ncbi:hypothetical protein PACTADRAFT_32429 [Pachysolen tannophilus NRRL Y-2460]|uniref:MHD domain-containing protein n=1 Tax=Pachysolen tannophilus NRRL Y-2460 TaxID=669874 RepID=A0A1E4TYV7_PACTA|nr:hypothetical protein PACTADRAFT_32429 [Pachysolen tannophilus NRRL Y-2460]